MARSASAPGRPARADFLNDTKHAATAFRLFDVEVVQRLVRESRREQGLSPTVTDPGAIARLAVLVKNR